MPRMLGLQPINRVLKGGANEGEGRGGPYDCVSAIHCFGLYRDKLEGAAVLAAHWPCTFSTRTGQSPSSYKTGYPAFSSRVTDKSRFCTISAVMSNSLIFLLLGR